MSAKIMRALIITVSFFAFTADANFIVNEDGFESNLTGSRYTTLTDTSTNLEWLSLNASTGHDTSDIFTSSEFSGWEVASFAQVLDLVQDYIDEYANITQDNWSAFNFSSDDSPELLRFLDVLGVTHYNNGHYTQFGYIEGGDLIRIRNMDISQHSNFSDDITYRTSHRLNASDVGVYLVRSVPEPSTLIMFSLALFSLHLKRAKQRKMPSKPLYL